VRIAPNELAFTDPQAWQDIQGIQENRRQNGKEIKYTYGPNAPGWEHQIIKADDEQHARLRRIYGPAFTPRAVDEQSEMLLRYADLLVETLKSNLKKDEVQDMNAMYNATTFDLTGEFAFDESFHCLEQGGKSHFFMDTVLGGVIAGHIIGQLERYGIWQIVEPLLPKSFFKQKYDMDEYTAAVIDRRTEKGFVPGKTDVMNYLLQNKQERDHLSREALIDNGLVLVVAGSETTATLLSGTTWLICRPENRTVYERVIKEVRSKFKSDADINPQSVNDLPYMVAVLNEAMRVFPPTPFGFPRKISAKAGQVVAGNFVPYDVGAVLYCINA
jgi:cytochrome P450